MSEELRDKFALLTNDDDFVRIDKTNFKPNEVLVRGGEGWTDKTGVLSPAAVFTTQPLLCPQECEQWIANAEAKTFDEGDFIFKTGKHGYERMPTGGRRSSATMVVTDVAFAKDMTAKLRPIIPLQLSDGRKFIGVRNSFLVSRYKEGQYFAPHFDGSGLAVDEVSGQQGQSEFVVVLYLSDDFEGGHTVYLPGQGSEIKHALAAKAPRGSGVAHRGVTVLHAGGRVTRGTK